MVHKQMEVQASEQTAKVEGITRVPNLEMEYVASARGDPQYGMYLGGAPWRTYALDCWFGPLQSYDRDRKFYNGSLEKGGVAAAALDALLDKLDAANWRDLFSKVVQQLGNADPLSILIRGTEEWVIAAQSSVFALTERDTLELVGACDAIAGGHGVFLAAIHLC